MARLRDRLHSIVETAVLSGSLNAETLSTPRALLLAIAELRRRQLEPVDRGARLEPYELRVFSQNGEDGVIAEIMKRLEVDRGYFVEFGASDGLQNNCVALVEIAGWQGLFMEADPRAHAVLEERFRAYPGIRTQRTMVTPENIESLLVEAEVPNELDMISIDVDGSDYWIWEALTACRPKVVAIEYNSCLPVDRLLVQPRDRSGGWDGSAAFGASAGAMKALGEKKGYRLVHTDLTGVNAFFVRADLAEPFSLDVVLRRSNYHFANLQLFTAMEDFSAFVDLEAL